MAYRQKCEKEKEENERGRKKKEKEEAEVARRQKEMDALKAKNASLLEKETALNKREELREKLEGVGQLLTDRNRKLKSSVNSSDKAGISAAEVMIETASGLSHKLSAEMSEMREKQRNVGCQKRKLIEKSLGEVPVRTKKARACASVRKQAEIRC